MNNKPDPILAIEPGPVLASSSSFTISDDSVDLQILAREGVVSSGVEVVVEDCVVVAIGILIDVVVALTVVVVVVVVVMVLIVVVVVVVVVVADLDLP